MARTSPRGPLRPLLLVLLLTACTPVYKTGYNLTPPPDPQGQLCVSQCQQTKYFCEQAGYSRRDACLARERADAERRYANYRIARARQGKKVERTLYSFDRSYRCGSVSRYAGSCENDFVGCFANCGGRVQPYSYCAAFCY